MNRAEQLADILELSLNEEFRIRQHGYSRFRIVEAGDHVIEHLNTKENEWCKCDEELTDLIVGNTTVDKIWFKPKKGEEYWFYSGGAEVDENAYKVLWCDSATDYALWNVNNCFRTKKEALKRGKLVNDEIRRLYEDVE